MRSERLLSALTTTALVLIAGRGAAATDVEAVDTRRNQVVLVQTVPGPSGVQVEVEPTPATPGRVLLPGQAITTSDNTWAELLVGWNTVVWLSPRTRLRVARDFEPSRGILLQVYRGRVRLLSSNEARTRPPRVQVGSQDIEFRGLGYVLQVSRTGAVVAGVLDGTLRITRPPDRTRWFLAEAGQRVTLDPTATWLRMERRPRAQMAAGTLPPERLVAFGSEFRTPTVGTWTSRGSEADFFHWSLEDWTSLDPSLATLRGPWIVTADP